MPAQPASERRITTKGGTVGKKTRSKPSWLRKQLGDLKNVAVGAVPATYETMKAIDQALPKGPIDALERSAFEREGRHLDPTGVKEQGKAQLNALRALGNPKAWKEDTALNLITALGAGATLTGVGGVAGSALNTAARGARKARAVPPSRIITAKPKNEKQAKKWAELRGHKLQGRSSGRSSCHYSRSAESRGQSSYQDSVAKQES